MKCLKCNADISESAKFCNQCGSSVRDHSCPNCGHTNKHGARFCGGCGSIIGSDTHPDQSSYRISQPVNQSMQFSASTTGYTPHEVIKPPYWYAVLAIVAGIVTVTIVPSIIGIFSLIKCSEASKANSRGDYEEAKKLAHQAIWNPLGMPPALIWIISILAVIGVIYLIITLTSY